MSDGAPAWEDPRRVLQRHGLRPKRAFSQNFLVSPHAVETIARAAVPAPGSWVVELGPGLGTLTAALLRAGARVLAVERDPDMVRVLRAELSSFELEIVPGDVTTLDYAALAAQLGGALCVVGNLPYAVTGEILRNLVDFRSSLSRALVMVQREVRDRLVAAPATAEYGALTVFTSAAFEVDTVLKVPAGAFHPPPKVDSAVVRLIPRREPLAHETEAFRSVVRAAFQSRRKTLRNALSKLHDAATAERVLSAALVDPGRRGETLSVAEFARLADELARQRS
jgi:16S rRNA (adenine1518-N6/adenine1519-N6)-dimethyltransferase